MDVRIPPNLLLQVTKILRQYSPSPHFVEAPSELDCNEATDLVPIWPSLRVAFRHRKPGYEKYAGEFTIREKSRAGGRTEIHKIKSGFGYWFFYCHVDANGAIWHWMIVDLNSFRFHLSENKIRSTVKPNRDGTALRVFDVRDFPSDPPILVASSEPI